MCKIVWLILFAQLIICVQYSPREDFPPRASVPVYKSTYEGLYYVNLEIGTPPQVQRAILDSELDLSVFVLADGCPDLSSTHCFDNTNSTTFIDVDESPDTSCDIVEDVMGIQGLNYSVTNRYCVVRYNSRSFELLQHMDGYLGIGYMTNGEDRETFDYWMKLFPPEWPKIFGLQFQGKDGDNQLHIGGYEHGDEIIWSEQQTNINTESLLFIEAPLYHITFCGEDLQTTSSFTVAQIVTYHNCLGLTQDLFDQILSWMPNCEEKISQDLNSGQINCFLKGDMEISDLPSLSFRLSEDGRDLIIPLSSLVTVVNTHDRKNNITQITLCLTRSKDFYSHDRDKLIFGIIPMESFYTVINAKEYRVGMYPYLHENETLDVNLNCPAVAQCKGEQLYDGSYNRCIDPICRIFQVVDNDTKTCKLSLLFIMFTSFILICISFIDFCAAEARLRLNTRVSSQNP